MKSIEDIMKEAAPASLALRRTIMRRIWYAYMISVVAHRFFVWGFLFGACVALFGRLVHVASVTDNVLSTPLRDVPQYVANAFWGAWTSGEILTVGVTLVMLIIGLAMVRTLIGLVLKHEGSLKVA